MGDADVEQDELEARLVAIEEDLDRARDALAELIRAVELLDARVGEWETRAP